MRATAKTADNAHNSAQQRHQRTEVDNMIDDKGKGMKRRRTHERGLRGDRVANPSKKGTSGGFLPKN